jgi:hypothetical protein
MRSIKVFVVRFIQDESEPDVLRGEVRSVASGEVRPFTDEQGMLTLLHRMRGVSIHGDIAAEFVKNQITKQTMEE